MNRRFAPACKTPGKMAALNCPALKPIIEELQADEKASLEYVGVAVIASTRPLR